MSKGKNPIMALLLIFIFSFMLQNASAANAIQFPVTAKSGIIMATIIILLVFTVTALVYMFSRLTNSYKAKAWATSQIYEALLSFFMLLVFATFVYLFLTNPQNAFGSVGLVPEACVSSSNIFELSVCDVTTFNNYALSLTKASFILLYIVGLNSGFKKTFPIFEYAGPFVNSQASVSLSLKSLLPTSSFVPAELMVIGLIAALALSNVQSILLASSMLFLSFFIIVGLVSRTFGFSRSFGGVMVAIGLGLGLVYPLIVSITYGFIDTTMYQSYTAALIQLPKLIISITGVILAMVIKSSTLSVISSTTVSTIFKSFGYTIAGLTVIPLMNFMILETFIVDFSTAIGERISFMQLLSGYI